MTVRAAKTQISLGIRPVWSESSLCAWWVSKDPSFLHANSEGSDQTGHMPRLIRIFAGRPCHFVGFVMRRLICCTCKRNKSWLVTGFCFLWCHTVPGSLMFYLWINDHLDRLWFLTCFSLGNYGYRKRTELQNNIHWLVMVNDTCNADQNL